MPVDGSSPAVALADWDDDWNPNVAWLEDNDLLVTMNGGTKFFRLPTGGAPAKRPIAIDTGAVHGGSPRDADDSGRDEAPGTSPEDFETQVSRRGRLEFEVVRFAD